MKIIWLIGIFALGFAAGMVTETDIQGYYVFSIDTRNN